MRDPESFFACRQFQGAPGLADYRHTFLVLDGQQRLTSLYQAFYGVGDHRYYLNLKALLDGGEFEEAIFDERATTRRVKTLESFETQAEELILPLSVLQGGSGRFAQWTRSVARTKAEKKRDRLEDALVEIEERWIKTIDDYHFPVVTLSDRITPDALCTIFETLNRTGVKLTVFELLTARFWPKKVNLRQLWDTARERHPILKDYWIDPYYILQAISLVSRETPSCKRSDVLNLEANHIDAWWDRVAAGLAVGLTILRDDCGVVVPRWLPYQTMLVTLACGTRRHAAPRDP